MSDGPRDREATTPPRPDQPPAQPAEQPDDDESTGNDGGEVNINTTFGRPSDDED